MDADACPGVIRDILYRAARRTGLSLTLVANQPVTTPSAANIRALQVGQGADVADALIAERVEAGDLVITADIPLAAAVIERGATALDFRGEAYTAENIRGRLSMRNFMADLRGSGVATGGPPPLDKRDRQAFANQLDRWIARHG